MDAARREQHDRIAGREPFAEHQSIAAFDDADARRREIDTLGLDDAAERRRFAAAPGHAASVACALPAADEILHAFLIAEPRAAAGRPIRVGRQRRRTDGDEIVDGHRDRVLRDRVVVAATGERAYDVRDEGFRSETFGDRGDEHAADFDEIRRFAARGFDLGGTVPRQVGGRGARCLLRQNLRGVERPVVNAGGGVVETGLLHRLCSADFAHHTGPRARPVPRSARELVEQLLRFRAYAAPNRERFGRLLDEHAPALYCPRGAVTFRPRDERRVARAVDEVVAKALRSHDRRRKRRRLTFEPGRGRVDEHVERRQLGELCERARQYGPVLRAAPRSWSARSLVRFAIVSSAGCSASNGPTMPRAAPPAPSTTILRPVSACRWLTVTSRMKPTPSVLSPTKRPSTMLIVLTARRSLRRGAVLFAQRERRLFVRHRDVQALAAGCAEAAHGRFENCRLGLDELVSEPLAGLPREHRMDQR